MRSSVACLLVLVGSFLVGCAPRGADGTAGALSGANAAPAEPGDDGAEKPAPGLAWVDEASGKTLFTVDDIVRFDWDEQMFELTRSRAMDLGAWMVRHGHQFRRFVVRDKDGVIYSGQFVSPVSSIAFSGPTIAADGARLEPPLYAIDPGHPRTHITRGEERFDPRLREALRNAGVLGAISASRIPKPLERVRTDWHGKRDALKVRAEYFNETFRIGEPARAHVFFTGAPSQTHVPDQVVIAITLRANGGRFISRVRRDRVPPDVLSEGVYVCRFLPWRAAEGSAESEPKPGHAEISMSVSLAGRGDGRLADLELIEVPPRQVTLLPPK